MNFGHDGMNYHHVVKVIKDIGYTGPIGFEFFPMIERVEKMAQVGIDYPL